MKLTRRRRSRACLCSLSRDAQTAQAGPAIHVVKTATCGCCSDWVTHLRQRGLPGDRRQRARRDSDGAAARRAGRSALLPHRLGRRLCDRGPCPRRRHPAAARERPAAAGIAVPGMPMGSPGMEHGSHRQPYNDDPVHAGGAPDGVRAALTPRSARRRRSQPVQPSRPGSRTMPATDMTSAEHGGDDQQPGVEILVAAPVHDVQAPEEIVDPPERRAPRGHRAGVGGDVERRGPRHPRNRPARRAARRDIRWSFAVDPLDPRRARVAGMVGLGDPRRDGHRERRQRAGRWRDRRARGRPSRAA